MSTDTYYVYADHLATPRLISRAQDGGIVWRWDQADAFGLVQPNDNPAGLGQFVLNLPFPGQYYDGVNNGFYNYYRDYDPQTGRYIESDPIGLDGGINTYSYVVGNPISRIDPSGLWSFTFGGYAGPGFQISFGNDNGNGFMTGRVGFGWGAGYNYDPNGGIPGPAIKDPSTGGIVLSDSAVANFSAGPVTGSIEKGVGRNYSNENSSKYGGPSYSTSTPWWYGVRADASVGAQCTVYSGRR